MKVNVRYLLVLSILYVFVAVSETKEYKITRKLKLEQVYHLNCTSSNSTFNSTIIHITAVNTRHSDDVIHYIFANINRPFIMLKHCTKACKFELNTKNICNQKGKGISFQPDDSDISGLMLTKVFPYIDKKDTVDLNDAASIKKDIAQHFEWKIKEVADDKVIMEGESSSVDGNLDFTFKVHKEFKNTDNLPKNPVSGNITEFTLEMNGLPHNISSIRYAAEVMFFSSGEKNKGGLFQTKKYIDDEYTPGIFQLWSVHFPLYAGHEIFSSWKPVAYSSAKPSRETQLLVKNFDDNGKIGLKGKLGRSENSDIYTIVDGMKNIGFYSLNITYGLTKDGFYEHNPYVSWTGMVGYYKSTSDSISNTVITVITIGVGAPAVFILIGILALLVRKIKLRKSGYELIN